MSNELPLDNHGRSVSLDSDGITDTYTVRDETDTIVMTINQPIGTPLTHIYEELNAMRPIEIEEAE